MTDTPEICENIDRCMFIRRFRGHKALVNNDWINKYCKNWIKSEECERKIYMRESECGCQPVDNLAPNGDYL